MQADGIVNTEQLPSRYASRLDAAESESAVRALYEEYRYFHEHPLKYGTFTRINLKTIPHLTANERQTILQIQSEHPAPKTWSDLPETFSPDLMEILQYTTVLPSETRLTGEVRWRIKSATSKDMQSYTRLRISDQNGGTGSFVMERDPGEPVLTDHFSGGILFKEKYGFDRIIIGQFRLRLGTGLSFGNALGMAKSGDVTGNVDRVRNTLRVNDSSLESVGYTGLAGRIRFGNHQVQLAGAMSLRDGSWDGTQLTLSQSGLHQTEGSRSRTNAIQEQFISAGYQYVTTWGDLGGHYSEIRYRRRNATSWIQQQRYGSLWLASERFIHETGLDANLQRAHFTAISWNISPVEIAFSHRWYAPGYEVPTARGFSEFSGTNNETGWYLGLQTETGAVRWSWYFDFFREVDSGTGPPRQGTEWFIRSRWRPKPRMALTGSIQRESKEIENSQVVQGIIYHQGVRREKSRYRLRWEYQWQSDIAATVQSDFVTVQYPDDLKQGRQWAFRITLPLAERSRWQVFCVPYVVDESDASTYYFTMPVIGTMQLLRQTGTGAVLGQQLRFQFRNNAEMTIFYLQRRAESSKLERSFTFQMDIAF